MNAKQATEAFDLTAHEKEEKAHSLTYLVISWL